MNWLETAFDFFIYGFLFYSILLIIVYGWIGLYAKGAIKSYIRKNSFTDYSLIATSSNAPTFSLIAPAYNEGATIVENVRSLLSLYYNQLEIIIVNDGSKDDSLQRLIEAYDLIKIDYFVEGNIKTKPINAIYKSTNPVFKKLVIVDKVNGGKSDALNVGINIATNDYIVCIDVDCILEQDAILKLAKPFMDEAKAKVIACGGVIRLANNCTIIDGKIVDVNLPKTRLGRAQALEYIRAFVLGRMAWSRANGLMLISGAFGAFDREIVLQCGGYDHDTVGEDMELVVRMRRYMHENKLPYKVVNIPDPLCWTEVPESKEILNKQRNRWMRGTIETLWKHRILFFNPKYGKLGMMSYPYWFFFEFLGPIIEYLGWIIFFILMFLGLINWHIFFPLMIFVLLYGILYSIYAILIDLMTYNVYNKKGDIPKLFLTAFIEPFTFHPFVVLAAVKGVKDFFLKNNSWGEMTRQGFGGNQAKELSVLQKMKLGFVNLVQQTTFISLIYLLLFGVSTIVEISFYKQNLTPHAHQTLFLDLFVHNIDFALDSIFIVSLIYFLLQFYSIGWAKKWVIFAYSFLIVANIGLIKYFETTLNLLGSDLFLYTFDELKLIIGASGVMNVTNIILSLVVISLLTLIFTYSYKLKIKQKYLQFPLIVLSLFAIIIPINLFVKDAENDEFSSNLVLSKSSYFFSNSLEQFAEDKITEIDFLNANSTAKNQDNRNYPDKENYPFLYQDDNQNFFAKQFNLSTEKPNVVFIVIEGLGRAYSNDGAYLGSFTPYIDQLSKKSLYWENGLSTTGRTYGVLPALTGSLPFAENGFMEQNNLPQHFNLYNLLKSNGYKTGYFYGGDADFDFMSKYLYYSQVETIIDEDDYGNDYAKIPSNNGFSWGYDDHSVFKKYLTIQKEDGQPYFNVLMTLATHSPFLINNVEKYNKQFDKLVETRNYDATTLATIKKYKQQLVTFLSVDDALKNFFETYQKRSDFNQTIFVITGDHRMPEVPMETKIDRFHVPIIVYSPLLKSPKKMSNIVTHFDIAPTFATYFRDSYRMNLPHHVTWMGQNLENGKSNFRKQGVPLMQNKNILDDYVFENYHLSGGKLYRIEKNLTEDLEQNSKMEDELKNRMKSFKTKNHSLKNIQKMVPDSIFNRYIN
ncbi:sulfatase-like hydrolase/transferase [Empedobacter stercoris]|uniref:sulfatase-like hydrolase/transferase n=1 Tax=Empedobacter stercoris TaxID=1628248 RepID=UPI00294FF7B8|nr:sulfatase-like hydrolase/transferase [Empedobacter stercoris]